MYHIRCSKAPVSDYSGGEMEKRSAVGAHQWGREPFAMIPSAQGLD
jgi:hypothetical protein